MNENLPAEAIQSPQLPADVSATTDLYRDPVAGTWTQVFDLIQDGGPVLLILVALSVVAATIILLKLYQFYRLRLGDLEATEEAARHWQEHRTPQALSTLRQSPNPVARVLAAAIRGLDRSALPESKVREEVQRVAATELKQLGAYLRGLDTIVTLAPLLGLFGTVLGMIEAFRELEAAGGRADPALLAGGIWEALLTTAAGLGVAIPASAALHWLESVVDRVRHNMEDAATRLFTSGIAQPAAHPDPAMPLQESVLHAD